MNLKDDDLVSAVALVVDTGEEAVLPLADGEVEPEQDGPADVEA
jgi:hypothetical protein